MGDRRVVAILFVRLMQEEDVKWHVIYWSRRRRPRMRGREMATRGKITRKRRFEKTNPIHRNSLR